MTTAADPDGVAPVEDIGLSVAEAEAASVPQPRDAAYWAAKVDRLQVSDDVAEAGFNVSGRRLTGPQQGFGRLWQRTYTATVGPAVTARDLVAEWKSHFGELWPKGNAFYGGLTGPMTPGDVAPIHVNTGAGLKLATGVLVLYADDESFTFMTPQGHMFAGWITFSASDVDGSTVAQIQVLIRPNDPMYELGWPVMKRMEDRFWKATLKNLALRHGVRDVDVDIKTVLVDKHRIWRNWRNIWHNAGIRTVLHLLTGPVRFVTHRRQRGSH